MRLKVLACTVALAAGGCAWIRDQLRPAGPPPFYPPVPVGYATIEVDQVELAGGDLSFRLLVSAVDGGVVLDRRMVPNTNVELEHALDCDAGTELRHIFVDSFVWEPGPSDLIELRPDMWYGLFERFPIFLHDPDGGTPDCVDAIFTLHLESALNPHLPFRLRAARVVPGSDAGQPDASQF